jgi:glycosyltransferase involved in cell wall biosynthesis
MKILFVGPFPPPLTGNSLPFKVLYDSLSSEHELEIIDLSKRNHKPGIDSFERLIEIFVIFLQFSIKFRQNDLLYISVSESRMGNLRDLIFYFIAKRKIDKVFLHMLGGAGMAEILKNDSLVFRLNKYFVSKVGGIIVEGQVQRDMFRKLIDKSRIKIVTNFAQDLLFSDDLTVYNKFQNVSVFRILFLSNMLPGKGHQELLSAYMSLDPVLKRRFRVDFAGKIVEEDWKKRFLSVLDSEPNLFYHGSVDFEAKRKLLQESHIFCLPTYYKFEGQPFTIIEAYATGNVVVTTAHSGIVNIFNLHNGYEVEKQSVDSLINLFKSIDKIRVNFSDIAKGNLDYARMNFTQGNFVDNIKNFINI